MKGFFLNFIRKNKWKQSFI